MYESDNQTLQDLKDTFIRNMNHELRTPLFLLWRQA